MRGIHNKNWIIEEPCESKGFTHGFEGEFRRVTSGSTSNGFQLAAEWMGWENIMSCEIDEFCNQITKYYWPNCKQYEDIRKTDFTFWRGKTDVFTGGFPCQPFSHAGNRYGSYENR